MTFRLPYAIAALIVFLTEVAIAAYLHDPFIRPYVGDSLAVILIYLGLRAITPVRIYPALAIALIIAFALEFGQLFHMLDALGLHDSRIARIVLGGVFEVKDLGCYVAGAALAVLHRRLIGRRAVPGPGGRHVVKFQMTMPSASSPSSASCGP